MLILSVQLHTHIMNCYVYAWSVSNCSDIFSDTESIIDPDATTVAYGDEDFETGLATEPWDKFVLSSQNDSFLSSQTSEPGCIYCKDD